MKGYIKNKSSMWTHAMKRAIGPGATVSLDELYEQYGKKYALPEGEDFIAWLKTVKLTDKNKWEIVLGTSEAEKQEADKVIATTTAANRAKSISPKNMEVEDIVQLSVRQARDILPNMTDLKLLKYALQEASPRAGKDSLCRILRKRIQDLTVSR